MATSEKTPADPTLGLYCTKCNKDGRWTLTADVSATADFLKQVSIQVIGTCPHCGETRQLGADIIEVS